MSKYIEYDALLDKLDYDHDLEQWCIYDDDLNNLPAADVAPVVHAKWINEVELYPERYGWVSLTNVVCTACKKTSRAQTPYCHNCGATMEDDKHEQS